MGKSLSLMGKLHLCARTTSPLGASRRSNPRQPVREQALAALDGGAHGLACRNRDCP
jgi:hypothetical protein